MKPLARSLATLGVVVLLSACQSAQEERPVAEAAAESKPVTIAKKAFSPGNELGMIPVLEYHRFGTVEERWTRTYANFRKDLEWLYANDYVLINASDLAEGRLDVPAGKKPVVLTFDDSTSEQFKFAKTADGAIKRDAQGKPVLEPNCAVAIMDAFAKKHPDFGTASTFYVLPGAFETPDEAPEKLRYLVETGREVGSHTYAHNNLSKMSPEAIADNLSKAQAEVARALGKPYAFKTLALPFGIFPKSESAYAAVIKGPDYHHLAVMLVGADPAPSPYDKRWKAAKVPRIQAIDDEFKRHFNRPQGSTARTEERFRPYLSDGDPEVVSFPEKLHDRLNPASLKGRKAMPHAQAAPAATR